MTFVADEVAYLQSLVPLANTHLVELGCGNASFARQLHEEVRRRFEAHMTSSGAKFTRPMRVSLMRRPAA